MNDLNRFAPAVLSLLRIASAYMFILHGTAKFFSFPVAMGGGAPSGIYLVAAILEVRPARWPSCWAAACCCFWAC